jgi:hypothetical protein
MIAKVIDYYNAVADVWPTFSDEALALRFAERHADDLSYVAA